jgi:Mg2+ and Co2+ transporter CorA
MISAHLMLNFSSFRLSVVIAVQQLMTKVNKTLYIVCFLMIWLLFVCSSFGLNFKTKQV